MTRRFLIKVAKMSDKTKLNLLLMHFNPKGEWRNLIAVQSGKIALWKKDARSVKIREECADLISKLEKYNSRPIRAKVLKYSYPALNSMDAAKHKWFNPKQYQLSDEKNNQRGNIQIYDYLTRRNSELLAALRVEVKKKDKVH